ncbi:dTDP-glucose 4,6-dehydratase [Candidatus Woesearchaeota archaeon]|nr:dTDP-glucose 4,6-dehydratase [Candidatus Woesearchaeota archaeon]
MKVLVTGGAGFIGSNFIRHLLGNSSDVEVVNLDKLTYAGNLNNLKDISGSSRYSGRYKFIKGDICDAAAVEKAMKGCNAVVNFAAESHVDRSISDAQPFVRTNFTGTYVLLNVAGKLGVGKFLQVSTDEVYGSRGKGHFTENDKLTPSSPYSASKAAADLLALSYFTTHRMPVVVARSSNNFGPYQHPEKLIPLFITNAFEDKPLPVYGDGLYRRDWLFVEDNCEAIALVMEKGKPGEIYNIGGGNERANLEVTNSVLAVLSKPKSLITHVADRPGHDLRYAIDSAKIKKLGWKPAHRFEDALKATVEWYKDNERWWKPLKKRQ